MVPEDMCAHLWLLMRDSSLGRLSYSWQTAKWKILLSLAIEIIQNISFNEEYVLFAKRKILSLVICSLWWNLLRMDDW